MQHVIVASMLVVSALAVPLAQRAPLASDRRTRDVYVGVVDNNGKPVSGLGVADFTVREDGVAREVVGVRTATEPLTVSLLVDDSGAASEALQFMRDGLGSFVERLSGRAEIAVATFGERPTTLVDFTTDTDKLKKAVTRIFPRSDSGAYLLDAIVDVSRGLQKREAVRPTIVVVTTEGVEFSNRSYQQVLEALANSGAALHVLSLGQPSSSQVDEMRNRNIVVAEGTQRTGGRRDQVLALSGLPERLTQLADELTMQYVVTYGRPDQLIPPEKIDVKVTRPGLTARARTRAGAR